MAFNVHNKKINGNKVIVNHNKNIINPHINAMLHPIILGRPFLRTIGAIINMKEGTIKYQFPLKKGMEHFPRRSNKILFDSILRANYELDASSLDIT
jgi:hypothetical protein